LKENFFRGDTDRGTGLCTLVYQASVALAFFLGLMNVGSTSSIVTVSACAAKVIDVKATDSLLRGQDDGFYAKLSESKK
jgi:hypothetical protein